MKKLLLLSLVIFCISASAQTDYYDAITGLGTSPNGRAPQGARVATRSVWIITATEMAASGFSTGSVVNSLGFNFQAGLSAPVTGNISIYLENTADASNLKSTTWATAVTGMTTVSNGAVTLPAAAGIFDITFVGGTSFTYTGGGLYIAFDYQNFSNPLPATSSVAFCNNALAGGIKTGLAAAGATTAPTTTAASAFRPETRLGKSVSCSRPSNVLEDITSKTTTSIKVSWNSTSSTNIEYGLYGFTPGTGTTVSGIVSPYTIIGLTPSTVYDVYLVNNCGTQVSPVLSAVTSVKSFNTIFVAASPTYNTSFEQQNFDFLGWKLFTGTPPGSDWQIQNFGPGALVQQGDVSIYSLSAVTTAAANNWVVSRGINLTNGNTTTVSFYIRNYQDTGSTGSASYKFTVGSAQNVASQTTVIATEPAFASQAWTLKTYTFVPTTTGIYYFGIQNTSPANAVGRQGLFVDNFTVTEAPLSTKDFIGSKFSVSPNPANDFINISNSENIKVSNIKITDLNGRVVKQNNFDNVSNINLNVSDLSSGVYMMNINTNEGSTVKKIIKN